MIVLLIHNLITRKAHIATDALLKLSLSIGPDKFLVEPPVVVGIVISMWK